LAYHLHWSWTELIGLTVAERRAYVEMLSDQIERENARMAEAHNN